MKKESKVLHVFVSALIAVFSLLPASLALADDGGDSGAGGVSAVTHVEVGDHEISSSVNVTASDTTEHDGEDNAAAASSSTVRHQEIEHHSDNSDRDNSDEMDTEFEVDQNSANDATTTIDTPEHVTTKGELRSFLNHVVKADDRIADVQVSSTSVEAHYDMPAKFLWVIPASITTNVSVKNDGSVTVTYPWYAFLFATPGSSLETQLKAQAASSTGASATTSFTANVQAHLLNALFAALKGSAGQQ